VFVLPQLGVRSPHHVLGREKQDIRTARCHAAGRLTEVGVVADVDSERHPVLIERRIFATCVEQ
jgi:hypothetical protein